jgi:hypothetical protein
MNNQIEKYQENHIGVWYKLVGNEKVFCLPHDCLEHNICHQELVYKGSGKQIGKARHDDDIYYDEDEYEDGERKEWDELEVEEQIEVILQNHYGDSEYADENSAYNPFKSEYSLWVLKFTWEQGTETQTVNAKTLSEAKDIVRAKYGEIWNIYDMTNEPTEDWAFEVAMNREKEMQHCE